MDTAAQPAAPHQQPAALPEPTYLTDRLYHWAGTTPDAEAITYLSRTWTWAQWADRIHRAAVALRANGIGRGDVVSFLDKNHPGCVELSMAASSIGAANAIVNWRSSPDEVEYAVNDCGARLLVVGVELLPQIEAIRERLPSVERVLAITPEGTEGDEYEAFLRSVATGDLGSDRGESNSGAAHEVSADDTCLILYSSGTTGRPKGVMLTHRNMIRHTINAHDGWGFDPGDKSMVSMPLFHVGGSSYVLFGIHDGVPSVMTRDPDGASLAGAIMAGANRTFLVPAVLAQVLQSGADAIRLFGALKTYTYGAAPMPPPLLRAAIDAWPDTDFIQVYGLTEIAGVATHLLPQEHREILAGDRPERLMSAGKPLPECGVRIVDPATLEDVATGQAGEIWLRTPQLMKGYFGKPEATAEAVTADGWFRTGDIGHRDRDGYVYVSDRLKDMIVTGGENVYSLEVERVLSDHPAVGEVAVIGVPDPTWGEKVLAVVTLKEGASATQEEFIAFCRAQLASFKALRAVEVVTELPRNPTGKILKRELRKPYWEGQDRQV